MIKFIRYLLITLICLAALAYGTVWILGDYFIKQAGSPLTNQLIGVFGPGEDDEYGFDAGMRLWPVRAEVTDLYITAGALRVGEDTFTGAHLGVDKIVCEPGPLIRDKRVVISDAEGRAFQGTLSNSQLVEHLMRTSEGLSDLSISMHNERCRITGRFGLVTVVPMTVVGDWSVDGRGVATLVNREYYNPDSPVPQGMIDILEEIINFDVRISIFGEELIAREVTYGSDGLWISASQEEPHQRSFN